MNLNLLCGFFSYKDHYSGGFLFGTGHIIFIVFAVLTLPLLAWLSRKLGEKKYRIILTVLFVAATVLEVIKIALEGYQDIKYGGGKFNYGGLLPLYLCSMFMYVMPFAIWGKGRVKQCACSFLATFGIIGALANLVYPQILNGYPVWSFAGLHSMLYHYTMMYVGISFWVTGYYKPQIKDIFHSYIPLAIFSVPVIIIDYVFKFDYMFYRGDFFPFSILAQHMPDPVWTAVLLVGYLAVNALLFYLPYYIVTRVRAKKSPPVNQ